MKKISALVFAAVLLVSCSGNGGKKEILESLKGEWVYKASAESEVVSDASRENEYHGELVYEIESRIIFSEDYSFVVTNSTNFVSYQPATGDSVFSEEDVKAQINQSNTMEGSFAATSKVLTMKYKQMNAESVNYSVEGNKLMLTPNFKNAKTTVYIKSE